MLRALGEYGSDQEDDLHAATGSASPSYKAHNGDASSSKHKAQEYERSSVRMQEAGRNQCVLEQRLQDKERDQVALYKEFEEERSELREEMKQ